MVERWQSCSDSRKINKPTANLLYVLSFYCSFLYHSTITYTINHFSFPVVLATTDPSFMVYSLFFQGVCQTSDQKVSLISHTFHISSKNFIDQAQSLLEHLNLQLFNFFPSFCISMSSILKEYLSLRTKSFVSQKFELTFTFLGWRFMWNGCEV